MKKVTSIITLLFITVAGIYAQDSTSSGSDSTSSGNTSGTTGDYNNNSSSAYGTSRWSDTGYTRRNRSMYDSLLRMHQGYWNQESGYYIKSMGDTVRPYGRTEWMRDSLSFENRNWDSSYMGIDRWGSENDMSTDQSGTSGTSGSMNGQTGTSSTGNMGTGAGTMGSDSTGTSDSHLETTSGSLGNLSTSENANNQSGLTTERKASTATARTITSISKNETSSKMIDRVYMRGSQLMVSRNGKSTKVLESIRVNDGTVILANGTIQLPDGNTMKLKTGESINLDQKSNNSKTNNNNSNSSENDNQK